LQLKECGTVLKGNIQEGQYSHEKKYIDLNRLQQYQVNLITGQGKYLENKE
jgi:hypothetical protein